MKNLPKAVLVEDLIPLTITNLNRLFNLKRIGKRTKVMNIYQTYLGEKSLAASLLITLNIEEGDDYILLEYEYGGETFRRRIELLCQVSSLGKGYWYYFKCPVTDVRCKKLYFHESEFVSRSAISNIHYKKQTESERLRNNLKIDRKVKACYEAIIKGFKPYAKPYYRCRSTKTKQKLEMAQITLKRIKKANGYFNTDYR